MKLYVYVALSVLVSATVVGVGVGLATSLYGARIGALGGAIVGPLFLLNPFVRKTTLVGGITTALLLGLGGAFLGLLGTMMEPHGSGSISGSDFGNTLYGALIVGTFGLIAGGFVGGLVGLGVVFLRSRNGKRH